MVSLGEITNGKEHPTESRPLIFSAKTWVCSSQIYTCKRGVEFSVKVRNKIIISLLCWSVLLCWLLQTAPKNAGTGTCRRET